MPILGQQYVGDYLLMHRLASGGMGTIFLARNRLDEGPVVVLKLLVDGYADNDRYDQMLLSEAALVASLRHSNIVKLIDFGSTEDVKFLVFEYLAGENLREILQTRAANRATFPSMPVRLRLNVLSDVARALSYMHGTGRDGGAVLHRDVSPSNIMVTDHGEVKLIDMGIARKANSAETSPGTLKGKYGYMAPEYIANKYHDHRVDIWSLGVVAYELFTERRLFNAPEAPQVLHMVMTQEIPPLRSRAPHIPEGVAEVVHRCLERDPAKRYGTALEAGAAFAAAASVLPQDEQFPSLEAWMQIAFAQRIAERDSLRTALMSHRLSALPPEFEMTEEVSHGTRTQTASNRRGLRRNTMSVSVVRPPDAVIEVSPPPSITGTQIAPSGPITGQNALVTGGQQIVAPPPTAPTPAPPAKRKRGGAIAAALLLTAGGASAAYVASRSQPPAAVEANSAACTYRNIGLQELEKGNCAAASGMFNRALTERCEAKDLVDLYKMSLDLCNGKAPDGQPGTTQQALAQAKLVIASVPTNAQVFIDGASVGTTPLNATVAPGQHAVRLVAPNGDEFESTIDAAGNHINTVSHTFPVNVASSQDNRRPTKRQPAESTDGKAATQRPRVAAPDNTTLDPARTAALATGSPSNSQSPSLPPVTGAPGVQAANTGPSGITNAVATTAAAPTGVTTAGSAKVATAPSTVNSSPSTVAAAGALATAKPAQPSITASQPTPTTQPGITATAPTQAGQATGSVQIDAPNVSGGEVFINGQRYGREPLTVRGLTGAVNVEVRSAGTVVHQRTITIKTGTKLSWRPL